MIITHRITEGRKRKTLRRRRNGERTELGGGELMQERDNDRGIGRQTRVRGWKETDLLQVQAKNISAKFSDTCSIRADDPEMSD